MTFAELLGKLLDGQEMDPAAMRWALEAMIGNRCSEVEAAGFLVALRAKGVTAGELANAALVLRESMIAWDPGADVLDTCGTGGDGLGTFNISTGAALVAAAAGARVVKHGNRSVSSRSGSADVLEALGVRIDADAEFAGRCLQEANFAFCFAPRFHPALKNVAAVRRTLGVPTIFNSLGPLANPARAQRQLIGVGSASQLDLFAGALARLGTRNAIVVASDDRLDEVSLAAPVRVRYVRGARIAEATWHADDFGLEKSEVKQLSALHPRESACIIEEVLAGKDGAPLRVVVANAAAALLAAERVGDLRGGVQQARDAIMSGKARTILGTLRRLSAESS
jgi:anthranilate phosphoribosyltransferase